MQAEGIFRTRLDAAREMLLAWVIHCDKENVEEDIMWQGVRTLQTEKYNVKKLIEEQEK